MLKTYLFLVFPLFICVVISACTGPAQRRPPPVGHPDCRICGETPARTDTIRIALLQPVRPERAPRPRNAGERLLFGHLFETLITIDCRGEVQAGLASSWRPRRQGRCWTFQLRPDVRFSGGSLMSAHDILASWNSCLPDLINPVTGIDSFRADSDGELSVFFSRPQPRVPGLLAHPDFAVTKPDLYSIWPQGTGPYRTLTRRYGNHPRGYRRIQIQAAENPDGPVIIFIEAANHDIRDLLSRGIDLIVTDNPAAIEYASDQPRFDTAALPWNRMYVLLDAGRIEAIDRGERPGDISPALNTALARDAVRSEARGSEPPEWWERLDECFGQAWTPGGGTPGYARAGITDQTGRIVYDSADPVARDLAERLAALAGADPALSDEAAALFQAAPGLAAGSGGLTAAGLPPDDFNICLRNGEAAAYVIRLDRRPYDFCYEIRRLSDLVPWLAGRPEHLRTALVPLVDTRPVAIRVTDNIDLVVDGNGNILITTGLEPSELIQ